MIEPHRVQRKRTRGWRTPPNTAYVGRPTRWGNPFRVGIWGTAQECVDAYEKWMSNDTSPEMCAWRNSLFDNPKFDHHYSGMGGFIMMCAPYYSFLGLRGMNLSCWCSLNEPCHADVLLRLVNESRTR